MKNVMRYVMQFMICLMIGGAMLVGTGQTVFAVTTLPGEQDTPSEGCVLLGERGDFYSDAQEAIARINEIRYEACTTSVKDPRDQSRNLTEADYVPLEWSQALEMIARLRAAETVPAVAMKGTVGHYRANGKNALSVSYGGITSSAEDIAWNGGTGMLGGIEQWYSEKTDWDNNTEGAETGHYTSMINPSYRYVGLGAFKCYNSVNGSSNVVVGELSGTCGNLGTEMLSPQMDIIQTIEVKERYITGYTFLGKGTLNTDQQCRYTPLAIGKLSISSKNAGYFWLVDEYSLTVSDPDIASIDENNNVTAHKAGTFGISIHSRGEILHTEMITVRCNHDKVLLSEEEATCTATGTAHYHCDVCGKEFDETIAKKPHDYVFSEAGDDGKSTGVCSSCGDTVTVAIPTGISSWWSNSSTGDGWYSSQIPSDNPVGSTLDYNCSITGGETGYKQIVFESTDESVVSSRIVTSTTGSLAINGAGIAKLTVYPLYNKSLAKTYVLRAGSEGDIAISRATVSVVNSMPYTGSEKKPNVTVTFRGVTLSKGTDYTVAYENNTNAGQAKIIISGAGIFGGTVEKTFTIDPIQLTKSNVTISQTSYECDGTEKKPAVTVKYNSKTLTEGEHYDVTYENNINPGTATVKVTGKGNYTGAIVSEFTMTHSSHTYIEETTKEPTCIQDGTKTFTCSICGDSYTEVISARHKYVHHEAVAATCTGDGMSEYYSCSGCDKVFDKDKKVTTADALKVAAGHKYVHHDAVPSTCTDDGMAEYYSCSGCDKVFNKDKKDTTIADLKIAAGHKYVHHDAVPSTCTEDGMAEYYSCSGCDQVFDKDKKATTLADLKIAAGHKYVHHYAVAATCTEDGMAEYYSCSGCDQVFEKDKKVTTADALKIAAGHKYVYHDEVPSTCTEDGMAEYYSCSGCDQVFDKDKKVTTADALKVAAGHKYVHHDAVPSTCTEDGMAEYYSCSGCNKVFDKDKNKTTAEALLIGALGHDWVYVTDVAPTCEKDGTESLHCRACGTVKEGTSRSIPKTGHQFGEWKTTKAATELAEGQQTRVCAVCGKKETRAVAQLKPSLPAVKIAKPKVEKKKVTIKWTKVSKNNQKKIGKIQIQYSLDKTFKTGAKTVTASKKASSKTLSTTKLKAKKTYYVRIRAYKKTGNTVHISKWSATRQFVKK